MKITWLENHRYNIPEDVSFMINELDEKQAEIERLREQLRVAVWSDSEECKMLEADNQRLRAALERIAECKTFTDREYMLGIACAALDLRTAALDALIEEDVKLLDEEPRT